MTFRIEVFTENKSLGDVMEALSRIKGVSIPEAPQPVVNRTKGGKAIAGTKMEAALKVLDQLPTPFTGTALRLALQGVGINSQSYYINHWQKLKFIKAKERGTYVKLPRKVA